MNANTEQLNLLTESIEERLTSIETNRIYYKNASYRLFIASTFLSGITTVLLGVNNDLKDYFRIAALILTTIVTMLNAYNAFSSQKELWVANNIARNRFFELEFNIAFAAKSDNPITEEQLGYFKKNYQDILNELNATWQKNKLKEK